MSGKSRYVQKSVLVSSAEAFQIPRSLEEISENEIVRKQLIGKVMTHTLKYMTSRFTDDGFEWLLPVIFSQSTDPLWPDPNASIDKRVELEIYGKIVRPTASMMIQKLVACSLAHPKLFILSPNVRIEKRERAVTGMHAYEFTQLDFEVRDARSEDIRRFVEDVVCGLIRSLEKNLYSELLYLRRGIDIMAPTSPFSVYDKEKLAEKYGATWESKMASECKSPFWVVNFPREFYDFEDFETGIWDNYDLFLPRYGEVLSGARRESEYKKIAAKMEKTNIRKENYRVLLRLAKEGRMQSSAGAGIGIERLVSWLVEASHIGEVQLFPRIPGTVYEV